MKGGVGKSSTVVCLADTLAARGKGPVLVVDVDTQASSSHSLAGDECLTALIKDGLTIDRFLERRLIKGEILPLSHFVRRQVSNTTVAGKGSLDVALVASSTNLRLSERDILHKLTQQNLSLTGIEERLTATLAAELAVMGKEFKYILFDCAPRHLASDDGGDQLRQPCYRADYPRLYFCAGARRLFAQRPPRYDPSVGSSPAAGADHALAGAAEAWLGDSMEPFGRA